MTWDMESPKGLYSFLKIRPWDMPSMSYPIRQETLQGELSPVLMWTQISIVRNKG